MTLSVQTISTEIQNECIQAAAKCDLKKLENLVSQYGNQVIQQSYGSVKYGNHPFLGDVTTVGTPVIHAIIGDPLKFHTPKPTAEHETQISTVKYLIGHQADVQREGHGRNTALHYSVQLIDKYALPLTEMLLTAGSDPTVINEDGDSPIKMASYQNKQKIEAIFERHFPDYVNKLQKAQRWPGDAVICAELIENQTTALKVYLQEKGGDPNQTILIDGQQIPLIDQANMCGNEEASSLLVAANALPDRNPKMPSLAATSVKYNTTILKNLLSINSNPNLRVEDENSFSDVIWHEYAFATDPHIFALILPKIDVKAKSKDGLTIDQLFNPYLYPKAKENIQQLLAKTRKQIADLLDDPINRCLWNNQDFYSLLECAKDSIRLKDSSLWSDTIPDIDSDEEQAISDLAIFERVMSLTEKPVTKLRLKLLAPFVKYSDKSYYKKLDTFLKMPPLAFICAGTMLEELSNRLASLEALESGNSPKHQMILEMIQLSNNGCLTLRNNLIFR